MDIHINLQKNPKVSVIMSLYNSSAYLREAMDSILSQTFIDFEFIIIDDGSSDNSLEIVRSYTDKRIVILVNEKNLGSDLSLNKGFDIARGTYIARMDPDDVSMPTRLEEQVKYMDAHHDVIACGTWTESFGGNRPRIVHKRWTSDNDIKASMLFNTPFTHPSIMLRRETIEIHHLRYDPTYEHFADYALWVELAQYGAFANIPEVLFHYRLHEKSTSSVYSSIQKQGASNLRKGLLEKLGLTPTEEDMVTHNSLSPEKSKSDVWFENIRHANKEKNIYSEESLEKILAARSYLISVTNSTGFIKLWKRFVHAVTTLFSEKES